jgi:hypothetical protein
MTVKIENKRNETLNDTYMGVVGIYVYLYLEERLPFFLLFRHSGKNGCGHGGLFAMTSN